MHIDLPANIRLHQVAILGDWRDRFAQSLDASGLDELQGATELMPCLFDEILSLLEGDDSNRIPCFHQQSSMGWLAAFPANISICLKLLNAGEVAIRSFLLESCLAFHLKPKFVGERFLQDLNKATHILIHREIQGICELSLRPITERYERVEGCGDRRRQPSADKPSTIQSI